MSHFDHLWQMLDRAATVAMLLASLSVVWAVVSSRSAATTAAGAAAGRIVEVDGRVAAETVANAAVKGAPQARVVIMEFSDYQCPFCARNAREVHPQLQREFVDTGRVRYMFLNFPIETIHARAFKAAEAAECAGRQGKYWEMHDYLFDNQTSLAVGDLLRYAADLKRSREGFVDCLGGEVASKIRDDVALGRKLGVSSTPVFFIGQLQSDGTIELRRKVSGALGFATFKTALEGLLNN